MAEETKKEERIKCPCCGELTLRKPLEIKSLILDEYMASIVTGIPFSHTYTVHDTIDVTATVPTKSETQLMLTVSQRLDNLASTVTAADSIAEAVLNDKIRAAVGMIQTYGTITSIVTHNKDKIIKTYTPAESIKKFCLAVGELGNDKEKIVAAYETCDTADSLSTLPDLMLRAISKTHNDIYTILLDTGFNETFWKGIELA
jgi:hypothetical protein